jgi:DNA-binding response OmpR family regulator
MNPRVLILEDDAQQRRDLQSLVEQEFHAEVQTQASEFEFRRNLESIAANPPQLAILDVMVKWTKPSREAPPIPADAKQPETAGVRCARMLRDNVKTQNVKVILYSVLPKEDFETGGIPEGVATVVKEVEFDNLLDKIRELSRKDIGPDRREV